MTVSQNCFDSKNGDKVAVASAVLTGELTQVQTLWLKALRSNKYKQAKGVLKNTGNEYCCLGVLCDISNLGSFTDAGDYDCGGTDKHRRILPEAVRRWVNLKDKTGSYGVTSLTDQNDFNNKTFKQIANLIEKNSEELFEK
jgi:hypothetical protein